MAPFAAKSVHSQLAEQCLLKIVWFAKVQGEYAVYWEDKFSGHHMTATSLL
jgi:hypothetical protein